MNHEVTKTQKHKTIEVFLSVFVSWWSKVLCPLCAPQFKRNVDPKPDPWVSSIRGGTVETTY